MRADLVLYSHFVSNFQWWESASVFGQPFCSSHVAVAEGLLTCRESVLPGRVGVGNDRVEWV